MRDYIFNRETLKIELHFEKSEYTALSEEQKKDLKSAFLWSRSQSAWVSRSKEPNLYYAKQVAKKLGFEREERIGERLTFAEQVAKKAERAEARSDRMEELAENAAKRGNELQKPLNDMRGDTAFFTQPNINTAGGRRFTNYRNKLYERYDRGFDEYRKSEYFLSRAKAAKETADMSKYSDVAYLNRRIKEVKSEIKKRRKNVGIYEERLDRIDAGEVLKRYDGSVITKDQVEDALENELEMIDAAIDKEMFLRNAYDKMGGGKFNQSNIKAGYKVLVQRWGVGEVVSTGPKNFMFSSGSWHWPLEFAYDEILKVVEENEKEKEIHPFKIGDEFTVRGKTYRIIKATDSTVTLQSGEEKPFLRKPRKSIYNNKWSISVCDAYDGNVYKEESKND